MTPKILSIMSSKPQATSHKPQDFKSLVCLLFFLFLALMQADAQEMQDIAAANEQSLQKAQELFWQLKSWQDTKDWENFFALRDEYESKISALLNSIEEPIYLRLKATYFRYKLNDFLGKKTRKEVLDDFLDQVSQIKDPDSQSLSFIKEVISDLDDTSKRNMKRKLSSLYVQLLKSSTSQEILRRQADSFYSSGDLDNFVALSKSYLSLIQDNNQRKKYILRLIEKTSCDGFKESCEPYFTEELFGKLESDFGPIVSEGLLYLRAYNLERSFEYQKAVSAYNKFLSSFPGSDLYDEVVFRMGFIYMYQLRDFDSAKMYFRKLKDESLGFKKHKMILDSQETLDTEGYNQKAFLDVLLSQSPLSSGVLQLKSSSSRAFVDGRLSVESTSFLPDTGCLAPEGLFLWSGDLGEVKITTNTPTFSTSFKKPGFKSLHLVEKIKDGFVGTDSALIAVHNVDLVTQEEGNWKNFQATIEPELASDLSTLQWKVYKDGEVVALQESDNFSYLFRQPGEYTLDFSLIYLGRQVYSKELAFSIE